MLPGRQVPDGSQPSGRLLSYPLLHTKRVPALNNWDANTMAQASEPAAASICGVDDYATDGCEIALGWQQPNALRVAFRGTTNWGLTSNKKQDLGFYYRVELSLTADFATVAATQNVQLANQDDDVVGGTLYEGVLFEGLAAGDTHFLRVAAFSFFLGDWRTVTSGTMVLGTPGAPEVVNISTGIFNGPYIEVCVRVCTCSV